MTLARNLLVLLTLTLSALHSFSQVPRPLWEVDLSHFGYQGRPPSALEHVSPASVYKFSWAYQQGVVFTDSNVAVAYFVVRDGSVGVSESHEPRISDSFRLVAIFLNTKNGAPIKKLEWTLPNDPNQVSSSFFYPAGQGRFAIILGNTVQLYSSDFRLLAHFDSHGEMNPIASASGESLLLQTGNDRVLQYDLLDSGTLSVLKSWSEPVVDLPHKIDSIWDDRLAWTMRSTLYLETPASQPTKLFAVRPGFCAAMSGSVNAGPAGPACKEQNNLPTLSGDFCAGWHFVSRDTLAGLVCSGDSKLLTVSSEGKIIREFNLGLEQPDGPVVASSNGQRFAIPTMRWGLAQNNVPEQLTARVFDLSSGNVLLRLNIPAGVDASRGFFYDSYGDTRFGWGGLGLSPGGDLLAVKSGASVRIYRVPDQPAASQCDANCKNQAASSTIPPTQPHPVATPSPASPLIEQLLSWLPADTETLTAATGPLLMPKMSQDTSGAMSIETSPNEVRDLFKQYFLLQLLSLQKEFKGAHISAAIEGSRRFRPPTGLGMATYQGALIATFTDDITARAAQFMEDSASTIVRTEQSEGQNVAVFSNKSEDDIVTTYVAFPKSAVLVVATDESYLREVLGRIGGKSGERTLPDTLPEWKHLDASADFWALRHYSKTNPGIGSLSPPICRGSSENAIGFTFSYSPDKSKLATIDYLSANEDSLRCIQEELFNQNERGMGEMHAQYNEVQRGVLEGTYNLEQIESAQYFVFVLEALLGHPIFV